MRVALVYKRLSLQGGSERQFLALAGGLSAAGHEVHLFCRSVRCTPPEGVALHVMPPIVAPGAGSLLFSSWAARAVGRQERSHGPFDVRHAFGRTLGQDLYRLGGGCHRTYLDHAHALDRPAWLRRLLVGSPAQRATLHLERRMLSGSPPPFVITNSEMARSDLLQRFPLPEHHVRIVRNGVDLQRFRPATPGERAERRGALGLATDEPVLLFLGSGYGRKGLQSLLRALPRLRHPARLVVAGSDGRLAWWRRLARELGVDARVLWLGGRDDPEGLCQASDVMVLPSAYDPSANATLEALASGLPVVTSAMNGAIEVLRDGVHGTVLPTPVRPNALAAAIDHWLQCDRAVVAEACRACAEQHPAELTLSGTLDVYRAVVEDRRQPRRTPLILGNGTAWPRIASTAPIRRASSSASTSIATPSPSRSSPSS